MSDFWANDGAEYDDDDVYKDSPLGLDMFPASTPLIDTDLYINGDDPATKAQGGTKSHYTPVGGGTTILDTGNKSSYQFSVERPVWVDGWWETTSVDGKLQRKQPMTLVVLKFVMQTFEKDLRVQSIKATLQFKDTDPDRKDDPEVQAWAPFHDLEDWNPTKAEEKVTTNKTATATVGYDPSSLTLGWSKDREVSWNRTDFDEGRSILYKSKQKQRPIGVTWSLKQNKLENRGVKPIIWAAVLIKRKVSDSPYLVKFRLDVRTGTHHDLPSKGLERLGFQPGHTSTFKVAPKPGVWDESNCSGEGEDIRDSNIVDLNNLGSLVGKNRTAFSGSWGLQHQRSAFNATEPEQAEPAAPGAGTQPLLQDTTDDAKPTLPLATTVPTLVTPLSDRKHGQTILKTHEDSPLPRQQSYQAPQVAVGTLSEEGGVSSSRLVALEVRAANAEARLAALEHLLLQLQQAVDVRDAGFARIEQAIRVAGTAFSQTK